MSLIFLTSHPHYLKCGSKQDGSIFTGILSGMDQPAYPLHAKLCQDYPLLTPILLYWKQVIKVSSSPLIQVEQVYLSEFLDIFIIPALEYSQSMDKEMGFGPGYLARLWPFTVQKHILTLKSYQEYPSDYFPETESQILSSLKDAEQAQLFRNIMQASVVKDVAQCIMQYGSNWLELPKFFAAGADNRWNNLFWRVVLRVLGRQVTLQVI